MLGRAALLLRHAREESAPHTWFDGPTYFAVCTIGDSPSRTAQSGGAARGMVQPVFRAASYVRSCQQHPGGPVIPPIRDEEGSLALPFPPIPQPSTEKLPEKESSHQDRKRGELPSQPRQQPQGDDKEDGQVDCQKPRQGEPLHARPPVAKREIEDKDCECDFRQPQHGLQSAPVPFQPSERSPSPGRRPGGASHGLRFSTTGSNAPSLPWVTGSRAYVT
jgi:hypothetical protein